MPGLRQQVPSSRHSVLRRNLEYHRVANSPRGIAYAVAVLLAQGAPTGLLLTRLARRGKFSWRSVGNEIVSDGATYAYVAGSTTIAFALFGGVLGHCADRLARLATTDSLTGLLNARGFTNACAKKSHEPGDMVARWRC
jgi:hypothetical protein